MLVIPSFKKAAFVVGGEYGFGVVRCRMKDWSVPVSVGADASVATGPVGRSAAAATDAQMHAEMLSYSRSQRLFAGIDVSGGCCDGIKKRTRGPTGHRQGPRGD